MKFVRTAAGLFAATVIAASACGDSSLFAPDRRQSHAIPTCYGRAATIYADDADGSSITGTAAADVIVGGPGPDTISGLQGDDRVCAGGGNDVVAGGPGSDRLDGEDGTDVLDYSTSAGAVQPNLASVRGRGGDAEGDRIDNFENVDGSAFDDVITGNAAPNNLRGLAGDDVFRPGLGADELAGGDGVDRVQYAASGGAVHVDLLTGAGFYNDADGDSYAGIEDVVGTAAADTLIGDGNDNLLNGLGGADVLIGNAGADRMFGREGNDELSGGAGNDVLRGGADDNDVDGGADDDVAVNESCMDVIVNVERTRGTCSFGVLDHFLIEAAGGGAIPNQSSSTEFQIMVTARDDQNRIVADFTGTVALTYSGAASGGLGNTAAFQNGVLLDHFVIFTAEGDVQIHAAGGGKTGASNTFSMSERPFTGADQAAFNSTPGAPFHTPYETDLVIATSSPQNLMANDLRGFPAANVLSFGAIQCNNGAGTLNAATGVVTTNAAGATLDLSAMPGCGASTLTVNADGSVTYQPADGYTGLIRFIYRIGNAGGTSDGNVAFAVGVLPAAQNDVYNGGALIGGMTLNTASGTPYSAGSNDAGDNRAYGVVQAHFGPIDFNPDGTFSYTPHVSDAGASIISYSITNGFGSDTANLEFHVGDNRAWFVDGSVATSGTGIQSSPFKNLSNIDNTGVSQQPQVGDLIFLFQNTTAYDNDFRGLFKLRAAQLLIGQDASASLATITGWTLAAHQEFPAMTPLDATNVSITESGIELGPGNTLRGFTLGPDGPGITGANFGTLTLGGDVAINTTGSALLLSNGTISGNLASLSASPNGRIVLTSVAGTTDLGAGTLSGTIDDVIRIDDSSDLTLTYGGNVTSTGSTVVLEGGSNVTLNGNISLLSGPGSLLQISNHTGTVTFGGELSASGGDIEVLSSHGTYNFGAITLNSAGVMLYDNTGASMNFNGDVAITSGQFSATSAGTLSVAGGDNTLSASGPNSAALYITDVTIASTNVNFRRIDATGGFAGIYLANTGALGSVVVSGSGTDGSGGSITNMSADDGSTGGTGIYLRHANNVKLKRMTISNHSNYAIRGIGISGFTLDSSTVAGTNGTTDGETSIRFDSIVGADTVRNSQISGGFTHNLFVNNTTGSPVLSTLVIDNNTFSALTGGDAINLTATAGTLDATVSNNTIEASTQQGLDVSVTGAATGVVVVSDNMISQTQSGADSDAGNVLLTGGALTYTLTGNTMRDANGPAIHVVKMANFSGVLRGTIDGNAIGVSGQVNSASAGSAAVLIEHSGNGTSTSTISNNVVREVNGAVAIQVTGGFATGGGGSGIINATITGNDIQQAGTTANPVRRGILVQIGEEGADAHTACLDIGGSASALHNSISSFGSNAITIAQFFNTIVALPGYTGGAHSTTDVAAYLQGRNSAPANSLSGNEGDGFMDTTPPGSNCPT